MPRNAKSKKAVLSDSDMELLKFLWKWKVSTTSALALKFYPHKNARRGYERLGVLEQAGLIQSMADSRARKFIWALSKKGYLTIKPKLPLLKEDGFRSAAPGHDLLSMAVMLGNWFLSPARGVLLISEQQLCRYDTTPVQVKQPYGTSHRADGYWGFVQKNCLIALEVQLTYQKAETYRHMTDFYALNEKEGTIRQVLWLVLQKSIAGQIKSHLSHSDADLSRHHFVLVKNFLKDGWAAQMEEGGPEGITISKLLHGYLDSAEPSMPTSNHRLLLDLRKSPHIAKNEVYYEPLDTWI